MTRIKMADDCCLFCGLHGETAGFALVERHARMWEIAMVRTPQKDLEREMQDPEYARLYAIEEKKTQRQIDKVLASRQTEKGFAKQVEHLFHLFGWRWTHSRPARTDKGWRTAISGDKGFPDYTAGRLKEGRARVLFAELKSETGKETEDQAIWRQLLERCPGVEMYLWKPSDWDRILEILSR